MACSLIATDLGSGGPNFGFQPARTVGGKAYNYWKTLGQPARGNLQLETLHRANDPVGLDNRVER